MLLFTSGTEDAEAIGHLFGDDLYHASLNTSEYEARLSENGYQVVVHRIQDPDCGGHRVWVAR